MLPKLAAHACKPRRRVQSAAACGCRQAHREGVREAVGCSHALAEEGQQAGAQGHAGGRASLLRHSRGRAPRSAAARTGGCCTCPRFPRAAQQMDRASGRATRSVAPTGAAHNACLSTEGGSLERKMKALPGHRPPQRDAPHVCAPARAGCRPQWTRGTAQTGVPPPLGPPDRLRRRSTRGRQASHRGEAGERQHGVSTGLPQPPAASRRFCGHAVAIHRPSGGCFHSPGGRCESLPQRFLSRSSPRRDTCSSRSEGKTGGTLSGLASII